MTKLIPLFISFFLSLSLQAQLVVDNTETVQWYVENVLLGGGVSVQNVTFNGAAADQVNIQCGYFDSQNANVGIDEGLILSSGNVGDAVGPNNNGSSGESIDMGELAVDPDLADIAGFDIFDAAILEFDFIPQGDTLSFNYVFASDEYPEFANGDYNDVFGFFVAGPGLAGPYTSPAGFPDGSTNIALIPGTNTPVAINDINNGMDNTGPCENCGYYTHNGDGFESPYDFDEQYIQFDGIINELTAFTEVECGETYHIKIVIADAGDGGYDSAVFLEAGSFSSNLLVQADLQFDIDQTFTDNTLYEGCFDGDLVFSRFSNIASAFTMNLSTTGTAINGVDFANIPNNLTFLPGDSTVTLNVSAFLDGLDEGVESVTLEILSNQNICGTNEPSTFTFYIADSAPPIILPDQTLDIDCNESIMIGDQAQGGFGMFNYTWSTGANNDSIMVNPAVTTVYTLTVMDTCVFEPATAEFTVNVPVYDDIEITVPQTLYVLECGATDVSIDPTVTGGSTPLMYQWLIAGVPDSTDPNIDYVADGDTQIDLIVTDQCGSSAGISTAVDVIPYELPQVDLDDNYFTDCTDTDIVLSPTQITGGQGEIEYAWTSAGATLGNGTSLEVITSTTITSVPVTLTITDECDNSATDDSEVIYQPAPPILISLPPSLELFCDDPAVNAMPISVSGGQDNEHSYAWYSASGTALSTNPELTTSTSVDTYYNLVVTDICDYTASAQLPVNVIPYIPLSISTQGDTLVCAGTTVEVSSGTSGGLEPISYEWSLAGLGIDSVASFAPESSELLSVFASDHCGNSVAGTINVLVSEVFPLFDLTMVPYHGFETNNLSSFIIDDQISYTWYVDQDPVSSEFELAMQYNDIDDHIVSLVMVNSAGCQDSVSVMTLGPPTLYVPNAFSPDNDGVNDKFAVKGSNIDQFQLKIFDRWGQLVFESTDIDQGWNGASARDSAYFGESELYSYRLVARGRDGLYYEKEGVITMIR